MNNRLIMNELAAASAVVLGMFRMRIVTLTDEKFNSIVTAAFDRLEAASAAADAAASGWHRVADRNGPLHEKLRCIDHAAFLLDEEAYKIRVIHTEWCNNQPLPATWEGAESDQRLHDDMRKTAAELYAISERARKTAADDAIDDVLNELRRRLMQKTQAAQSKAAA